MQTDPLNDLAALAMRYYGALRQQGIPEQLAQRMAGDWHQVMLQASAGEEQPVQIAEQATRRVVRGRHGPSSL